MSRNSAKRPKKSRDLLVSFIIAAVAAIALIAATVILRPTALSQISPQEPVPAHKTAGTRIPEPQHIQEHEQSVDKDFKTSPTTSLPEDLTNDGIEATRFETIKNAARKNPEACLPMLLEEFNRNDSAKSYWAAAISYLYLDQLKAPMQAITWMEKAILLQSRDKNLPESLVQLYAKMDEIGRAADFIQKIEYDSTKTILKAKMLILAQRSSEGKELLQSLPESDLDEASIQILKQYSNGDAS